MSNNPFIAKTAVARRRRIIDRAASLFAITMTVVGLIYLVWILATLLVNGFGGLSLNVFTRSMGASGSGGGLLNAIVGSVIQTVIGTVIGTPIGLMVGTYLAEYARQSVFGNLVRFVSDMLLSAPSILVGLFVYQLVVLHTGGFSAWAGGIALAMLVIPVVVRTTEDMLRLIPDTLREAAIGLGAPKWKMIRFVCYPAAKHGIITGILLAIARIAGETAPLIFTSFGNQRWSLDLGGAMASLPVTIYQYAATPNDDLVQLAWTGALLITAGVLGINLIARALLRGGAKG